MNTQYKSSVFVTYIYYITPIFFMSGFFYLLYYYFNTSILNEEAIFFIPIMLWASIASIVYVLHLKNIKVSEDNIIIKKIQGEEILDYKNIEWINQSSFGSNWFVLYIRYNVPEKNKKKTIVVFPEMYTMRENVRLFSFRELNITTYIRERIVKSNPNYIKENEPIRMYFFLIILASVIPFLLISFLLI